MLKFKPTMDSKASDVERDGVRIGSIQWHETMCFVTECDRFTRVSFSDMQEIVEKMKEIRTSEADRIITETAQKHEPMLTGRS